MKLLSLGKNKKIAGVCSGLADYFGIDVTVVRILFLISSLWFFIPVILYLICWIIMPNQENPDI